MCFAFVGLFFEVLVLAGALLANGNYAWKKHNDYGGLWKICSGGQDIEHRCHSYVADDATSFDHKWKEIQAARAMLIITLLFGLPLVIILVIAICTQCCAPTPFIGGIIFACLQLVSIVSACALMDHGFVTRKDDDTKMGHSLVIGWIGALCCMGLTIIMCSACCQCWGRCDKNHEQRGGSRRRQGEDEKHSLRSGRSGKPSRK